MSLQFATSRKIDSVWTLGFEIVDGKAVIHSFDRDNQTGYDKEKELPQVRIVEDDKRVIKSIKLAPYKPHMGQDFSEATSYEVANPKYVFSYK
jgi:hypothetical protein